MDIKVSIALVFFQGYCDVIEYPIIVVVLIVFDQVIVSV